MSLLNSLLLYNPLESLVLVLFCNIAINRLFNKKDFIFCYLLGSVNLFFQYFSTMIISKSISFIIDYLVVFVCMPIILYILYDKLISEKIRFSICFKAIIYSFVTMSVSIFILNSVFSNAYSFGCINSNYEFIYNALVRLIQITIILFFRLVVGKLGKRNVIKNCE